LREHVRHRFRREFCVFGVWKAQIFSGPQGQRLKAGAAEAPQGRRGQEKMLCEKISQIRWKSRKSGKPT
jgi:hypothetical protein